MRRLISFLLTAAVAVAVAVWLADRPGSVTILWLGWRVDTSMPVLLAAIVLVLVAISLAGRFLRSAGRGLTGVARRRTERRRRAGYRALTRGVAAVAAADAGEANRQARRAEVIEDEQPLARLLAAEAAAARGESARARREFEALADLPEAAILGLRGLLGEALRANDWPEALAIAERARRISPGTPWLLRILFELQARLDRWADAAATLALLQRTRSEDAALLARRQATVALALAAESAGTQPEAALRHARAAVASAPAFVPAVAMVARLEIAAGQPQRALATIEKAWPQTPHPDLAALYREALAAVDPLSRLKRLERLTSLNPAAAESHVLLGDETLEARLWGEARRHYERALALAPDAAAHACRQLAAIEIAEREDREAAVAWRERAAAMPAPPGWRCTACGTGAERWSPRCPHCGAVDRLEWRNGAAPRPAAIELPGSMLAPALDVAAAKAR